MRLDEQDECCGKQAQGALFLVVGLAGVRVGVFGPKGPLCREPVFPILRALLRFLSLPLFPSPLLQGLDISSCLGGRASLHYRQWHLR